MQVNSEESIEAGLRLIQAYGAWDAVRAAATRQPDGRLLVPAQPAAPAKAARRSNGG